MVNKMKIKNIIYDVGNVLVKWDPDQVIHTVLPYLNPKKVFQTMKAIWIDLNLGKFSEADAILKYVDLLNLPERQITNLIEEFKKQQIPIEGSIELLKKMKQLRLNLYIITNNTKGIMEYHKLHSDFPKFFKDMVVSADLGFLKPSPEIFQYLIDKHDLKPNESVFIDDTLENVEAALKLGIHALQFTDTLQCEKQLMNYEIPLAIL